MHMAQITIAPEQAVDDHTLAPIRAIDPHLVLVFGPTARFQNPQMADALALGLPDSLRMGCSTSGQIDGLSVLDHETVITGVRFREAGFVLRSERVADTADSDGAGRRLARQLAGTGLHTLIILACGVDINGSALIGGISAELGSGVKLVGGLAGDDGAFERTFTMCGASISDREVVALAICRESIAVAHGTFGGWEPFGLARRITHCEGNLLFALDNEPALAIYERYLGGHAADLPAAGLLFPLSVMDPDQKPMGLTRTILGIDRERGALLLAGDLPADGYVQLMHASTDQLVTGAETAAQATRSRLAAEAPGLALLVSCIGRKLVMGTRTDEEVEAVADILPAGSRIAGFYSNGEISPLLETVGCGLHNQTMTISFLHERA